MKSALVATVILAAIAIAYRNIRKNHRKNYKTVEDLIGNTPMVLLKEVNGSKIFGKCEFLNLSGSSKDRFVLYALKRMKTRQSRTVVEASMGSTAISLATISKIFNLNCKVFVPNISTDKTKYLRGLGSELKVLQDTSFVDSSHFIKAAEASLTGSDIYLDQFENELNWKSHYEITGPEIVKDLPDIDIFVMGLGTGCTLRGVAMYLKEYNPKIKIIIADPQGSGLFNKFKHGVLFHSLEKEGQRHRHQRDSIVEGIGQTRLSRLVQELYELEIVDDVLQITDEQVLHNAQELMDLGLFLGPSSALHFEVCKQMARKCPNSKIMTMLCDRGERYLSTLWDPLYMQSRLAPNETPKSN
eukprot:NODE_370_length_9954_cov_0.501776.p4 type:complete len:357 gc:universal NODE_370_length_9954_cov_0.501776:9010-7940(-)